MSDNTAVAIVGMACRLPESPDLDAYWHNLRSGRDCVRKDTDHTGSMVRAGGYVEDLEGFDTALFPMSAREAALLDPQHRMFLETSRAALESAGLPPGRVEASIGLFGGVGASTYLINNLLPDLQRRGDRTFLDSSADLQVLLATDKDYLTSRVAYLLDLRGPVLTVQAACATGLVAVHLAMQSLLNGECEIALAGAANASVPQLGRHLGEAGMVLSPDGVTRSYDARAAGTAFGSGAAVVALKLLSDAEADGDLVLATLTGSAVGNDGAGKVAMAAPSTRGQTAVIREAMAVAGLQPDELDYVEGHGTATPVGDPIEVQALTAALSAPPGGPVWLGSVKSQLGHLGTASGVAGLVKTVLMLQHRTLLPSANFSEPNPEAPFSDGVVAVLDRALPWPARADGVPRRAGVSAFGLGGVNAHVVVEEFVPQRSAATAHRPVSATPRQQLLAVSAASPAGLAATVRRLAGAVAPDAAAVARTLALGRTPLRHRVSVSVDTEDVASALGTLADQLATGVRTAHRAAVDPVLAVAFTGHHPDHLDLRGFETPAVLRIIGAADPVMVATTGVSATAVLLGGESGHDPLEVGQAAQYVLQAALLEQIREWGLSPQLFIGHSLGEFAACYAAGVLSLEAGVRLAAARGRLLHRLPLGGAMAAVGAPAERIEAVAGELGLVIDLAAVNGPRNAVVSGPGADVDALCRRMAEDGCRVKALGFGRAGHSRAVAAILPEFQAAVAAETLHAPVAGLISNLTGGPIGAEITDPACWARQLRETVRFSEGLDAIEAAGPAVLLELGPGAVLSGIAESRWAETGPRVVSGMRAGLPAAQTMVTALGSLWEAGFEVEWSAVVDVDAPRVSLPATVPDRSRHWIDAPPEDDGPPTLSNVQWVADDTAAPLLRGHWLVLGGGGATEAALCDSLRAAGHLVSRPPHWPAALDADADRAGDVLADLLCEVPVPLSGIVSFDVLDLLERADVELPEVLHAATRRGLAVLRAVCTSPHGDVRTLLLSRGVLESETVAAAVGAVPAAIARSAAREFPELRCIRVDLAEGSDPAADVHDLSAALAALLVSDDADVAYRRGQREVRRILPAPTIGVADLPTLDPDGVYLVTGGAGGLGLLTVADLLRRGAGEVVAASRGAHAAELGRRLADLVGADVAGRARAVALDVAERAAVDTLIAELDGPGHRLRGVVHCAAELADATLLNQSGPSVATALRAKAIGGWNLDRATRACTGLHLFTVYTSATGVLGNAGQANYAAACAFLDRLVDVRRADGLPGQAIAWGPWVGVGHLDDDEATRVALERDGMGALSASDGARLLPGLLGGPSRCVLVNDWDRWRAGAAVGELPAISRAPDPRDPGRGAAPGREDAPGREAEPAAGASAADLAADVARLMAEGQQAGAATLLTDRIADAATVVLGARPDADDDLGSAGLDSLSAVQLRNAVTRISGVQLPVTACLELRTTRRLAQAVLGELAEPAESEPAAAAHDLTGALR